MPKMCALHVPEMASAIYVNPAAVRILRIGVTGAQTIIEFEKDYSITVPMPIEQVRRLLDVALNADQPG